MTLWLGFVAVTERRTVSPSLVLPVESESVGTASSFRIVAPPTSSPSVALAETFPR